MSSRRKRERINYGECRPMGEANAVRMTGPGLQPCKGLLLAAHLRPLDARPRGLDAPRL